MRIAVCVLATFLAASLTTFVASSAAAPSRARVVFDLGDSLSLGTSPYLKRRLPGYGFVRYEDVGLHAYDAAALVAARRSSLPSILVISAGTNDDPRIVSTFRRSVTRVLASAGPGRCVVWPTIVRPPANGASYDGLNRSLARLAAGHPNLVLVDWVGMVRRHPRWLTSDGVHPGVVGYRARAAAIATAVMSRCST